MSPLKPLKPLKDFVHPFKNGKPYEVLVTKLTSGNNVGSVMAGPTYDSGMPGNNTLASVSPCGLRILLWNIQDLGGGPSRGPRRADWVIDRIATIISECDPDVVVILEVKQKGRVPKMPVKPVIKRYQLRSRKGAPEKDDDVLKRAEELYEKQMEKYKKAVALSEQDVLAAGESTGFRELDRILEALKGKGDPRWSRVPYAGPSFTLGESYGFLVRGGDSPMSAKMLDYKAPDGTRRAGCADLRFEVGLFEYPLPVVAFHAPAPKHGEVTHRAVRSIAATDCGPEYVFASDTNLSTDAGKREVYDAALDSLSEALSGGMVFGNTPVQLSFAGKFSGGCMIAGTNHDLQGYEVECIGEFIRDDWVNMQVDPAGNWAPTYIGDFTGFLLLKQTEPDGSREVEDGHLDSFEADRAAVLFTGTFTLGKVDPGSELFFKELLAAGGTFRIEPSLASGELTGATSLRRLVSVVADPGKQPYADTQVFNANAYDKLEHVCPDNGKFAHLDTYTYPLFERCLPPALHPRFATLLIDRDDVVANIAAETRKAGDKAPADLQEALDAANKVSDHVPLILDLAILTPPLKADALSKARGSLGIPMKVEPTSSPLTINSADFTEDDDYENDPDYDPNDRQNSESGGSLIDEDVRPAEASGEVMANPAQMAGGKRSHSEIGLDHKVSSAKRKKDEKGKQEEDRGGNVDMDDVDMDDVDMDDVDMDDIDMDDVDRDVSDMEVE